MRSKLTNEKIARIKPLIAKFSTSVQKKIIRVLLQFDKDLERERHVLNFTRKPGELFVEQMMVTLDEHGYPVEEVLLHGAKRWQLLEPLRRKRARQYAV